MHATGSTPVSIDQTAGDGNWTLLGTFDFAADGSESVAISDAQGGVIQVDAVRFEFLQLPALVSIDTTALPVAGVGVFYAASLTASCTTAPVTWSVTAGALPAGLILDPASGLISGTPTQVGVSGFTVQVVDANGDFDT